MASPIPTDFATTDITSQVTSHVLNLPANCVAGDRVAFAFGYTETANTITLPATGVVASRAIENTTGATMGLVGFVYEVQASETTITVTSSVNTKSGTVAVRVTGDENPATQAPEFSTGAIGTNAPPDPDSLAPTGGSKDYLFVAMGAMSHETAMSAAPTNYLNFNEADTGITGALIANGRCAIGTRQLTAASDDPGAFTGGDAAAEWAGMTLAFHPPSGAVAQQVDPAALTIAASIPAPAVTQQVSPGALAIAATIPAPAVLSLGPQEVSPGALTIVGSLPAPSVAQEVRPAALAVAAALPAPGVQLQVAPAALAVVAVLPAPQIAREVLPAPLAIAAALPAPTVTLPPPSTLVEVASLGISVTIPAPDVRRDTGTDLGDSGVGADRGPRPRREYVGRIGGRQVR